MSEPKSTWSMTIYGESTRGGTDKARARLNSSLHGFARRCARQLPVEIACVTALATGSEVSAAEQPGSETPTGEEG